MNETELYRRCQLFAEMLGNACGWGCGPLAPTKTVHKHLCP